MPVLLWDASALAKRYAPETASATVDALFSNAATSQMAITLLGYAETYSILLRTRNRGAISATTFTAAKSALRNDIINDPDFSVLAVDESAILNGIDLMDRYNINSSDAAILAAYKTHVLISLLSGASCVLVSTDHRFLRAAQREGLIALNPELLLPADVAAYLSRI